MPQVDIITGEPRHRKWTVEEKLSILAAAFAPGATVREIARRANVSTSQLYTWRKRLMNNNRDDGRGFAQVVTVADSRPVSAPTASALSSPAAPAAPPMPVHELPAIELDVKGNKVRIPGTMPPALASVVVRALVRR
jgi:transposase